MDPTVSNRTTDSLQSDLPSMFRPPLNRAMRVLDRSFFRKSVPLSAATVFRTTDIAPVRNAIAKSKDILSVPRVNVIREVIERGQDQNEIVRKCLLLREDIKYNDSETWSPKIRELVETGTVGLRPYMLELDYSYWTYADIISSILPEEELAEVPQGFTQVGHVAHLNLKEQYLPYKYLIAEVLKDKNRTVRTVINKTEDVGSHSEFRTFPFEFLAGDRDMNVVQHEQDCEFRFDYSRVYWNSRLETEHRRLVEKFEKGQMVCDVMAGVGPFAVPAGKKNIFVWANDLNPHAFEVMKDAIQKNKVRNFVTAFNRDGRDFIRWSAQALLSQEPATVMIRPKVRREKNSQQQQQQGSNGSSDPKQPSTPPPAPKVYVRPSVVDHYVMNLPATAIEFLNAFVGLYAGKEELFSPHTPQKLPMVHVYCFAGHSDNELDDHIDICKRISERIGYTIKPEDCAGGTRNPDIELAIHNVRLVSPKKQMFCAGFRLPRDVAFRKG